MFQKVSIFYNLSRIYHYYGKIIFVTVLGVSFVPNISYFNFLMIVLANIFMTVFFFSYNNVQDYKDDARDESKKMHNPISQGRISLFWARIISFSSLVISLLLIIIGTVFIFAREDGAALAQFSLKENKP